MIATEQAKLDPPEGFDLVSPDVLRISEGGGAVSLFGLPFLAAGVFLLLAAVGIVPFDNADQIEGWMYAVISLMALAFTSVGAGILFGRKWYTLDRGRGTIVVSRGLLVPMQNTETNYHYFNAVQLEFNSGDSDSPDRFAVFLKSSGMTKPILLVNGTDYGSARQSAVFIAEFLRFPLEDSTTDHTVKLDADQLQRSFRERARGDAPYGSAQPLHMKSQIERGNGRLKISIPQANRIAGSVLSFAIPLVVLSVFGRDVIDFLFSHETPEEVRLVALGFASLFILVPLIGIIRAKLASRRPGTIVTVDRETFTLWERNGRRKKTITVPVEDILDIDFGTKESLTSAISAGALQNRPLNRGIDPRLTAKQLSPGLTKALSLIAKYVPAKGVTVKSVQGLHSFGSGLPDDEIRYLHSLVSEFLRR